MRHSLSSSLMCATGGAFQSIESTYLGTTMFLRCAGLDRQAGMIRGSVLPGGGYLNFAREKRGDIVKELAFAALVVLAGCPSRSIEIGDSEPPVPDARIDQDFSSSMDMIEQWSDMVSSVFDMSVPVSDLSVRAADLSISSGVCIGWPCQLSASTCRPELICGQGSCTMRPCSATNNPCPALGLTCSKGRCFSGEGQRCDGCARPCSPFLGLRCSSSGTCYKNADSCSWYLNGVVQDGGKCLIERNASGITAVQAGPIGDLSVLIDFLAIDAVASPGTFKATAENNLILFIGGRPCAAAGSVQVYGSPMTIKGYAVCESTGKSVSLRFIVH